MSHLWKKTWRCKGAVGTIEPSIDFASAMMIPLLGERVGPLQWVFNPCYFLSRNSHFMYSWQLLGFLMWELISYKN